MANVLSVAAFPFILELLKTKHCNKNLVLETPKLGKPRKYG